MTAKKRLPLVDQKVLHELEEEFEDPRPARSFVRDFVAFWDERYLRVADAVRHGDPDATLDALLSVRISSTMIGASRLARLAAELEVSLKRGNTEAVAEALPELRQCGAATIKELTTNYIKTDW